MTTGKDLTGCCGVLPTGFEKIGDSRGEILNFLSLQLIIMERSISRKLYPVFLTSLRMGLSWNTSSSMVAVRMALLQLLIVTGHPWPMLSVNRIMVRQMP